MQLITQGIYLYDNKWLLVELDWGETSVYIDLQQFAGFYTVSRSTLNTKQSAGKKLIP